MFENIGKILFTVWISSLVALPANARTGDNGPAVSASKVQAPTAHIRIAQIGLSRGDARRILAREGYRDVEVIRESFKNIVLQACFRGVRYQIKVRRLTNKVVRGDKIGVCRRPLNVQQITDRLRQSGLDKISVSEGRRDEYTVAACDLDRRVRLRVDVFGKIISRADAGECRRGLSVDKVKRQLREEGFRRIRVLERERGRLVMEACLDREKVRLRLDRRGRVRQQDTIGRCARPFSQEQVIVMLQRRGANRVEVISQDRRGFRAAACYKQERREYKIDLYGEIRTRTVVGRCAPPPRIGQVLRDFKSRGLSNVRMFVEGCRKGRAMRIEIDRAGEELTREQVGRCRTR